MKIQLLIFFCAVIFSQIAFSQGTDSAKCPDLLKNAVKENNDNKKILADRKKGLKPFFIGSIDNFLKTYDECRNIQYDANDPKYKGMTATDAVMKVVKDNIKGVEAQAQCFRAVQGYIGGAVPDFEDMCVPNTSLNAKNLFPGSKGGKNTTEKNGYKCRGELFKVFSASNAVKESETALKKAKETCKK